MTTIVQVAHDATVHGFQTEPHTQAELYDDMKARWRAIEALRHEINQGRASDQIWEDLGRHSARVAELTRRMIVRRREDRYQQAAVNLANALSMVPLPGLALIYLMSGRMEDLASWILDQPEEESRPDKDPFQKPRLLAPEVIVARQAMGEPVWKKDDGKD